MSDDFEDVLAQNAQTGAPEIINTSVDRKSHLRRRLDWKRQARIKVGQKGDRITFAHPSNRWKPDNAGRWGHVYAMAQVRGQWRVWDVLALDGDRPAPGGLVEVSFPLSRLDGVGDGEMVGLFMAGTKSTARSYVTPLKVRMADSPPPDQPDPDEPAPDPPTDPPAAPGSLLATVQDLRAEYGTPLTNPEMGELLNRIAWRHRAEGWGLARKPTGARTIQPQTDVPISRDLLIHQATGDTYDVFGDVEGEARPTWNYIETGILQWVAPVDPGDEQPEEPEDPSEPEVPDDPPQPDPDPQPTPEPHFVSIDVPSEVTAGELFQIHWDTEDATHVELDRSAGPVAHDLRPVGAMGLRIYEGERYILSAANGERVGDVRAFDVVAVPAPPEPSWLDILRRIFGR